MNIIETKGLVKKFKDFTAVDGLDLEIQKGELFGFLGPNGAGKTTTIRMLTTLSSITSGSAKVAGFDVKTEPARVRERIGVVPQQFSLFEELTPVQNLWYIGKLNGMPDAEIKDRTNELLKIVTLYDKKDVKSGGFSGGMKQRLSVAAGLLHEPEILFMDEPTTGLDPQSRIALRELTNELNQNGITVVYTTHDMDEADKLCDRIAIMDHGIIIAEGTSEQLKHKVSKDQLIEVEVMDADDSLAKAVEKMPFVESVSRDGNLLLLNTSKTENAFFKLADFFKKQDREVREIRIREPSLEDVFIQLTKKDLRDESG
ncbi:ATP-binding cassette domain-containing protein [Candidatus Micrarchaeota archaeon]|nr:ATP-binding cassette domain-containing protein [Candidatus Micrarchaeota archaeon]